MDGEDCSSEPAAPAPMDFQLSRWYQLLECCAGEAIASQSVRIGHPVLCSFAAGAHKEGSILNSLPMLEKGEDS